MATTTRRRVVLRPLVVPQAIDSEPLEYSAPPTPKPPKRGPLIVGDNFTTLAPAEEREVLRRFAEQEAAEGPRWITAERRVTTVSGRKVSLDAPDPKDINILDIAHALSNICRFNGHVAEFYSVAQHSVMVSQLVPHRYAMVGLLHDATER